jgi:hypothetical protein
MKGETQMDDSEILAEVDQAVARLRREFCRGLLPGFDDIIALRVSRIVADYVMYCPEAPLSEDFRAAMTERLAR